MGAARGHLRPILSVRRRTLHAMRASDGTGQQGHVTPRHVWVDNEAPGILLDWRLVDGGRWMAHVVYASGELPARSVLEWLPEDRVRPRE